MVDDPKFLVVYNICEVKVQDHNRYCHHLEQLLKFNYKNYKLMVSGCKVTRNTKRIIFEKFKDKISYYFCENLVPVNMTFNRAVQRAVQHYGEFDGYIYIDSGIDIGESYNILNEIKERFNTNQYGMITIQVNTDHMQEQWFRGLTGPGLDHDYMIRKEDFIIPVNRCTNLHFQCFHNKIYKEFNNKIIPDIFYCWCTESCFAIITAAIDMKWVLLKDIIVTHHTGLDGPSNCSNDTRHSGSRNGAHNNCYGGIDFTPIMNSEEGKKAGFGYHEIPGNILCQHDSAAYNDDGTAKDSLALKNFIRKNLYLSNEYIDYNYLLEKFIP